MVTKSEVGGADFHQPHLAQCLSRENSITDKTDHHREGCRNIGEKDIKFAYGFKREEKSRFIFKQKSWVTADRKQSKA